VRGALGANARAVRELIKVKSTVPTVTFLGTGDPALDPRSFAATARAFAGPYRVIEVPGAGHFAHREDPELFARELLAFAAERLPANPVRTGSLDSPA
jgi:pimeloyl-ACP methyl ester carboxylesterase